MESSARSTRSRIRRRLPPQSAEEARASRAQGRADASRVRSGLTPADLLLGPPGRGPRGPAGAGEVQQRPGGAAQAARTGGHWRFVCPPSSTGRRGEGGTRGDGTGGGAGKGQARGGGIDGFWTAAADPHPPAPAHRIGVSDNSTPTALSRWDGTWTSTWRRMTPAVMAPRAPRPSRAGRPRPARAAAARPAAPGRARRAVGAGAAAAEGAAPAAGKGGGAGAWGQPPPAPNPTRGLPGVGAGSVDAPRDVNPEHSAPAPRGPPNPAPFGPRTPPVLPQAPEPGRGY